MKYLKYILIVGILAATFTSCYDEKMEWIEIESDLTVSDLPLPLAEKIARYDALKSYVSNSNFKLGMGVGIDFYLGNDTYADIVNANFNDLATGYAMKHAAMVGSDGNINTTRTDALVAKAQANGLSIFGHTLVWHQNANAAYLNRLIAPTVIPPSAGSNLVDLSGLKDGSFDGWSRLNNADGITIEAGKGLSSEDSAIKLVSTSASSNEWDTQLQSPEIPVVEGHAIMYTFWVRSEGDEDGAIRVSFKNMSNGYPWYNGAALIPTTGEWQQVSYGVNGDLLSTGSPVNFVFDFGKKPNTTYYVDINSIKVVDLDAEEGGVNYVTNGDFETGDLSGWTADNPGGGIEIVDTEKYEGTYSAQLIASSASSNEWDTQFRTTELPLETGTTYTISFFLKSDAEGQGRISFPGNENEWPWMNWQGTGASALFTTTPGVWEYFSFDFTPEVKATAAGIKLSFDLGKTPNVTYWLDNVVVTPKEESAPTLRSDGPTIIEKTEEEKAQIIGDAMEDWISQMVGHFKNSVKAWDVVNEPMSDGKPSDIKYGSEKAEHESDEFYWQDYLGKDYAVTAFNLARQYGNADDILFINDYNLEYNLAKCDGIIEYTKYIESKGAKVDGIGTQMHVSIDSNKDNIVEMFRKLAASGKLIKISELDIKVNTASPTLDQLEAQAEMYRFIIEKFLEIIPPAQQYGITIWGLSDHPDEHVSWIPNDAPNLWDANYERKWAYKGACDGFAGRDVSEDFPGDLVY